MSNCHLDLLVLSAECRRDDAILGTLFLGYSIFFLSFVWNFVIVIVGNSESRDIYRTAQCVTTLSIHTMRTTDLDCITNYNFDSKIPLLSGSCHHITLLIWPAPPQTSIFPLAYSLQPMRQPHIPVHRILAIYVKYTHTCSVPLGVLGKPIGWALSPCAG